MLGKATVNVDDGLEDIRWIRGLGGEKLPAASYAVLPNLKRVDFLPSKRDGDFVACFLPGTRQRPNVFVSDGWPTPTTYHRPFCKNCCCPWSCVRRYIDTCRGCVCSLAAVCWLAPAYWLCCASLLLKPGNTPYRFAYQHFLQYEDAIRDERRAIGDGVHLFGSSLNLSFSPPRWSTHFIKWLTIFGEYFLPLHHPLCFWSIHTYLTPTPCTSKYLTLTRTAPTTINSCNYISLPSSLPPGTLVPSRSMCSGGHAELLVFVCFFERGMTTTCYSLSHPT